MWPPRARSRRSPCQCLAPTRRSAKATHAARNFSCAAQARRRSFPAAMHFAPVAARLSMFARARCPRRYAAEMVALAPDVILTVASAATAAVQEATRTLPIVFVNVSDPVGAGYVASLARPGGNVTGFTFT